MTLLFAGVLFLKLIKKNFELFTLALVRNAHGVLAMVSGYFGEGEEAEGLHNPERSHSHPQPPMVRFGGVTALFVVAERLPLIGAHWFFRARHKYEANCDNHQSPGNKGW